MEEWKNPFDPQNFPSVKSGELLSSDDLSLGIAYLPQITKYAPMSSRYDEDISKSRGLQHRFVFYLGGDQKSNADFQFDTEFFDVSTGESTGIKMSNTWVDGQSSNSDELLSGGIRGGENARAFAFDHLTQSPELVKLRGKTVTPITHVTHIQSGKKITIGDSDPKKAQDRNKVHIFDLTADPEVSEFSVKDGVKTSVSLTMKNLPPTVKNGTLMHHFHLFKDGKPIESAVLHAGTLEGDIDVKPDPKGADGATTASIKGEFVIPAEHFDAIKEEHDIDSLDGYELRYMPNFTSENYHEVIDLMWTKDKFDVTPQFTVYLTDVTTIKLKDAKDGDELDTSQPPIDEDDDSDDPENPGAGDEGDEIPEEGEDAGDDKEQSPEELAPEDNRDGSSEEDEGSSGNEKAGDSKGGNSRDGAGKGAEDSGAVEDLAPEDGDTEGTEDEEEDGKSNDASEVKTGGEVTSKTGVLAAGIASLMAFAAGAVGLISRARKR